MVKLLDIPTCSVEGCTNYVHKSNNNTKNFCGKHYAEFISSKSNHVRTVIDRNQRRVILFEEQEWRGSGYCVDCNKRVTGYAMRCKPCEGLRKRIVGLQEYKSKVKELLQEYIKEWENGDIGTQFKVYMFKEDLEKL